MTRLAFTGNLNRHAACPPCEVAGATVRDALEGAFSRFPRVRGYVLDEQGALRQHVVVFLDGRTISDRRLQSDAIRAGSEIYVMQALSGG